MPNKEISRKLKQDFFPKLSSKKGYADPDEEVKSWARFADMLVILLLADGDEEERENNAVGRIPADEKELLSAFLPENKENTLSARAKELRGIFETLLQKSAGGGEQKNIWPLGRLLHSGMLSAFEIIAYILCAAFERERKYSRAFAILQGEDAEAQAPTVGVLTDLGRLFLTKEECRPEMLVYPDAFFQRYLVQNEVPADLPVIRVPLKLSRQALALAGGIRAGLGVLSECAREIRPQKAEKIYREDILKELMEIYAGMQGLSEAGIIYLSGEEGCGRQFLAEQLGAVAGVDLLVVSAPELLHVRDVSLNVLLRELVGSVFFEDRILYIRDMPSDPHALSEMSEVLVWLQDRLQIIVMGGENYVEHSFPIRGAFHLLTVSDPDESEQRLFWKLFGKELQICYASDVKLEELTSKYRMSPGRIRRTLNAARLHADVNKDAFVVDRSTIEREIRRGSSVSFGEYASKLQCRFVREDLKLTKEANKQLDLAMDRIRYRSIVHGDFGFGRKLPYGGGTSIVLYGPPGTGKTMTAQVIAAELGLDIYRIDLSQIENKYIGETEKSLGKIFEAAKHANVILFFDEADSLFSKRTDVTDSKDKHANAQTAFLLQKVEEYAGVSILATNVVGNFDPAFKRRMSFMIPIEAPDKEERMILWKSVFPKETPLAKDVDFKVYASVEGMTGSSIKAAAVNAAYRAAARGDKVTHFDIIEAINEEHKKNGHLSIRDELLSGGF